MFEDLIPELQPFAASLVAAAGASGLQPRVTSTLRTHTKQAQLYRRFQAGLSAYPAAPPGTSAHEFGYAFDMITQPMEALADVGQYWQELGGVWGGMNRDPIHFEFPGFEAPTPSTGEVSESSLASFAADIGLGFVPVYGTVTTVAGLATLFPSLSQNEALKMLASPTHYYNMVRRLMTAYGY
jgi:hypothetical protein